MARIYTISYSYHIQCTRRVYITRCIHGGAVMETVSFTSNQPTLKRRQWASARAIICNQNITIIVKSDRRSAVWHTEWLISAGTRTRSLWIRSPARYSIAPQRLRQDNSGLSRFRYLISSRIAVFCIPAASGPVWADMLVVPSPATRGRCCYIYKYRGRELRQAHWRTAGSWLRVFGK